MKFISATLVFLAFLSYGEGGTYTDRFLELYGTIVNVSNGYFSKEGVPYHCLETMYIVGIDYGHETNSEAQSYNVWLKAMYGAVTGNFSAFNEAWDIIETHFIPEAQYNSEKYNASAGGISSGATVGIDPIGPELMSTYGDNRVRVMHWLLDVDNIFGFGNTQGQCELGPSASGPSFINNGVGSVWEAITLPTCDNFTYGGTNGFSWYSSVPNYGYSSAPDAEARAIGAAYWASIWANQQGKSSTISSTLSKAAKLADYLRYMFFDKNFKKIGYCIGQESCEPGIGKDSAHYLVSWYIGWGGSIKTEGAYAWRKCSSEAHIGYQNPLAAYGITNEPGLNPSSASALEDWKNSLDRQLELYKWLQTDDGLLAGGVTNSWNASYADPPSEVKNNTFHGMWYKNHPGVDGSSIWFGMQSWSLDRLAQYYYLTGDTTAKSIVAKWVAWVISNSNVTSSGFKIPLSLSWTGSTPSDAKATLAASDSVIGIGSSIARTAIYYAAKSGDSQAKSFAKNLLDSIWNNYKDSVGFSTESTVENLSQVNTKVYIPLSGWSGTYPNGDKINSTSTFLDIRSWYKNDTNWPQLKAYLDGGPAPTFRYHRFWEQADLALALGAYGMLFNE